MLKAVHYFLSSMGSICGVHVKSHWSIHRYFLRNRLFLNIYINIYIYTHIYSKRKETKIVASLGNFERILHWRSKTFHRALSIIMQKRFYSCEIKTTNWRTAFVISIDRCLENKWHIVTLAGIKSFSTRLLYAHINDTR